MGHILIIEDDTYINHLIAKALTQEGYSCKQAFSGTEGLLYAGNERFSLVILDLMLPGMAGEEVLCAIKETYPETSGFRLLSCLPRTALTVKLNY